MTTYIVMYILLMGFMQPNNAAFHLSNTSIMRSRGVIDTGAMRANPANTEENIENEARDLGFIQECNK